MELCAASCVVLIAAVRILHHIGRSRAGPQLRYQIAVLCRLRGRQFEALVLGLQILHLAVHEEVKDCSAVAVCVVDNVACCVLHSVASIASLRRHIITHTLDAALGVAAIMLS